MTIVSIADRTINVPFHGASLCVVNHNGEPYTAMKPIIEGMGMDWASQFTKLKNRFNASIVKITMQLPGDDQRREVTCLALRKLAGWLHTISPNKVKADIREKVIQYQEECDDVLYEYWTKGEVKNPRAIRKSTTEERTPLRDAVNMLVSKKHLMYPEAYALVHQRFQVTSFEQLTPEQIEPAIEYVHSIILEGELLGRQNQQISLPLSYPMAYFEQYRHIVKPEELSAPWRYKPTHLRPDGDNPNPLGRLLLQLKELGYEIDAAMFQLMSMQHHLEETRRRIESIERAVRH